MPGIRTRTQNIVRREIAEAVLAVYLDRGFADVTVEEVAKEVGISRATFFRYFRSKEEAVYEAIEAASADTPALFTEIRRKDGESGWALFQRALRPIIEGVDDNPSRSRARTQLVQDNPSLVSYLAGRRLDKQPEVATALQRIGYEPLEAHVLAATAMAAFDLAWAQWPNEHNRTFAELVDTVFSTARALIAR